MATVTVNIPEEIAQREGLDARMVAIELACRLYDAQKLSKSEASGLCGLSRDEFDAELTARGLPLIRYTEEMWEQDRAHFSGVKAMEPGGESH